jgi:deoxyribodipyrimidine photo-lyase
MRMPASIMWFRQDLRLEDNPALCSAIQRGAPLLCLYVWSPDEEGEWPSGAAGRWWVHHSLKALGRSLSELGSSLILRKGSSKEEIFKLAKDAAADAIFWNRRYEPEALSRDGEVKAFLQEQGLKIHTSNGSLLFEPWEMATQNNKPFQMFTPFWKKCLSHKEIELPLAAPKKLPARKGAARSLPLEELELLPKIHWDAGIEKPWHPGEASAKKHLKKFIKDHLSEYSSQRDFLSVEGVSKMSPHLHHGEISPRTLWHEILPLYGKESPYLRQLGWREFAYHLLYHFPKTPTQPLKKNYQAFPWKRNSKALRAWQQGLTGYPIVDAAMRELWTTGWMHNRARLIAGSFLVKHLLQPWQEGAKWFWDTLVDADLANNTLGWQWVAGCGADAAPYFRIFNPVLQGQKFDAQGRYVRKWVPELAKLPDRWLHFPWEAPEEVLLKAQVALGKNYPFPIVDHRQARQQALEAFRTIKSILY